MGEAAASSPILRELKAIVPDAEVIVSTTTTAGQEMARKVIEDADQFIYFPLDMPFIVDRALSQVQPDVFVCVESELWPNFFAKANKRGIPIVNVNGIVSDRTHRRALKLKRFYAQVLSHVGRLMMQTKADADRIISLGAASDRVEVVGNCKFDQESEPLSNERVAELRSIYKIEQGTPVFVAGSTNPGEDMPVLDAFSIAREFHPDLRMIIAPRQIERAEELCEMAAAKGFSCGKRSKSEELTGAEDVIVLDTFGELAAIYGICDVSFVGGNLIPKGGHNVLQPIAQGKPVFFGPFTFKSRDLVSQAKDYSVGFEVRDGEDMGRQMSDLLSDTEKLTTIRENAFRMMNANRGASKRCAEVIAGELGVRAG